MERATGVEPATSSLGSWHSTTELRPPAVKSRVATSECQIRKGRETRGAAMRKERREEAPQKNRYPALPRSTPTFVLPQDTGEEIGVGKQKLPHSCRKQKPRIPAAQIEEGKD